VERGKWGRGKYIDKSSWIGGEGVITRKTMKMKQHEAMDKNHVLVVFE